MTGAEAQVSSASLAATLVHLERGFRSSLNKSQGKVTLGVPSILFVQAGLWLVCLLLLSDLLLHLAGPKRDNPKEIMVRHCLQISGLRLKTAMSSSFMWFVALAKRVRRNFGSMCTGSRQTHAAWLVE